MTAISKQILESLDNAIRNWDTELYNEIKEEYWIRDLADYEEEKREAYKSALGCPKEVNFY